ncbi:MAG: DUF2809 domain-containing protein [Myxococcaceae bacterium]|nr:DUF2809 domain-containing protein [Myxococcaceae bacterium]
MPPRTRPQWALFAAALFVVELLIATVWAHVPFVRADLGDYLVVILIYAAAKAVRPLPRTPLAIFVFALGVAVEISQALHLVDRLGLAHDSAAGIAIGTYADLSDIAMYAAGSATAWLLDGRKQPE